MAKTRAEFERETSRTIFLFLLDSIAPEVYADLMDVPYSLYRASGAKAQTYRDLDEAEPRNAIKSWARRHKLGGEFFVSDEVLHDPCWMLDVATLTLHFLVHTGVTPSGFVSVGAGSQILDLQGRIEAVYTYEPYAKSRPASRKEFLAQAAATFDSRAPEIEATVLGGNLRTPSRATRLRNMAWLIRYHVLQRDIDEAFLAEAFRSRATVYEGIQQAAKAIGLHNFKRPPGPKNNTS